MPLGRHTDVVREHSRAIAVLVATTAICVSACSGGSTNRSSPSTTARRPATPARMRTTVAIGDGIHHWVSVRAGGRTLVVSTPTCGGHPSVRVNEDSASVHLLATSTLGNPDQCLDGLVVRLKRPVGARVVIDDKTGARLRSRAG